VDKPVQRAGPPLGAVNGPGYPSGAHPGLLQSGAAAQRRRADAAGPSAGHRRAGAPPGGRAGAGRREGLHGDGAWLRPAYLDVHGILGGFTAAGKKTVIPARAGAKVSMRLVPDQDPDEIARLFEDYLTANAPRTVELEVRTLGAARPVIVGSAWTGDPAAAEAYRLGFGFSPAFQTRWRTVRSSVIFRTCSACRSS